MCSKLLKKLIGKAKADKTNQALAAAELELLIRRERLNKRALWNKKFDIILKNDLYADASKAHQKAYDLARKATAPDHLDDAIKKFQEAAEIRLHLGAFRPYCSSVNVMGSFGQHLAEWLALTSSNLVPEVLSEAKDSHKKSLQIAKTRGYRWEIGQAHIGLALLQLRIARFTGFAFSGDVAAANKHYLCAEQARDVNRDDENLRLDFFKVLLDIATESNLGRAVKIGRNGFYNLLQRNPPSESLRAALRLDLNVCEVIDGTRVVRTIVVPQTEWLRTYWSMRKEYLLDAIRDRNRASLTPWKLSRALFDPFFR